MSHVTPAQSEEFKVSGLQRTCVLVLCFLLYMINFMDRQVFSAVLEPMKIDLGFTDTQAGILQTSFFLSMAVLAFPAAYLVDRWSRRKTLSLMAIIWSAFTYITGLGRSLSGVFLPRILVGVGEAGFPSAGTAMLSAVYPQETRSRVLGIFNASIPLGSAMGALLGGFLSAHYGGWRTPFFVFAVPGIILGVLAFFLKDYKTVAVIADHGEKIGFWSSVINLFRIPTLRWLYIGYAMQMAMTFSFSAWGGAFVMRAQGVSEAKAGMILGVSALGGDNRCSAGRCNRGFVAKEEQKGAHVHPNPGFVRWSGPAISGSFSQRKGPGTCLDRDLGDICRIGDSRRERYFSGRSGSRTQGGGLGGRRWQRNNATKREPSARCRSSKRIWRSSREWSRWLIMC